MIRNTGKLGQRIVNTLILVALAIGSVLPVIGQTQRPTLKRSTRTTRLTRHATVPVRYFSINANQIIRVRMNDTVTSAIARIGDTFTTTVVDPVYGSGIELVPAGSVMVGRVTQVTRAARKSKAGTLGVEFISLRLPNGMSRALSGSLTSQSGATATYDNEGSVIGSSSTTRNVVFIGGGAAAGALIGAISGGGKGAGIGAGVGAGLGVAGAYFSKGKEAVVRPGTEFGVILNQSLSLPAAHVR